MSIPIFSTQQQFEGDGIFFVSGTSTQIIPGTLMLNNQIAYCKGPASSAMEANKSIVIFSASVQPMNKMWRVYFNNFDSHLHLERSPTSSFTWESVLTIPVASNWTYASGSASFTSVTSINNVDLAFDSYGYYYIVVEIPTSDKVTDDHTTDVLIFTNSFIGSIYDTAGSISIISGSISGTIDGLTYDVSGPDSSRSNPYYIGTTYPTYPPAQPTLGNISVLSTNNINYFNSRQQILWDVFPANSYNREHFSDATMMLYIPNARSPKVMWDGV